MTEIWPNRKFHMEMYFWHSAHWALWNNWDLLRRSSNIYSRFLDRSLKFAQVQQGWPSGARWPKMTGEIFPTPMSRMDVDDGQSQIRLVSSTLFG